MTRAPGSPAATRPRLLMVLLMAGMSACGWLGTSSDEQAPDATASAAASASATETLCAAGDVRCAAATVAHDAAYDGGDCDDPIPVFARGERLGEICAAAAERVGLTVVDLSDGWVPKVLQGSGELKEPYADVYRALANEQLTDDESFDRARHDRFFELYGVFPSPSVVAKRLADEERHRCHDRVDDQALDQLAEDVDTWRPLDKQRDDASRRAQLGKLLKKAAAAMNMSSIDELAEHKTYRAYYQVYKRLDTRLRAIREMQAHLRCEGMLDRGQLEMLDGNTIEAMEAYHRRHMIVSWQLDDETRRALLTDSRELDFRTLLRTLRERVVDAGGLIEDGSAAGQTSPVVDRVLDASAFLKSPIRSGEGGALDDAAPDLIGLATDVAARALGWLSPASALAFLKRSDTPQRVAIELPPRPDYHSQHMDLHMVIDRGDIWYDFPFAKNGDRYLRPVERRPSVVLYAHHQGKDIPLLRWPTTIGGWQPERMESGRHKGEVMLAYKESPAGSFIVRDIVAAPRWVPPESTPPRDLLRPRGEGRWAVRYDTFGPHYASAYGLAMLIHHRVDGRIGGRPKLTDLGIRTHGSVSYQSIHEGFSHGCHRLHNHRAVRLSDFLLSHRHHEVRGPIALGYARTFEFRKQTKRMEFDSRGFRYELTPPLPVEVLAGRVMGKAQGPLDPRPLTEQLEDRYKEYEYD